VLAALGASWAVPARIEAYLAVLTGLLVVGIGMWMLRGQWAALSSKAGGDHRHPREHEHPHGHVHGHSHEPVEPNAHSHAVPPAPEPPHGHAHDLPPGYHRHGFGRAHAHNLDLVTTGRPSWAILLGLGVAGGLLPDPGALAILLAALASGKVVLGLLTVLVFSLGFASVLVLVGIVAARVGQLVLTWLESRWILWLQLGTGLLILAVGVILTVNAGRTLAALG
jgi:nickel/cobalt exporter